MPDRRIPCRRLGEGASTAALRSEVSVLHDRTAAANGLEEVTSSHCRQYARGACSTF
jgi:hypothetical protein